MLVLLLLIFCVCAEPQNFDFIASQCPTTRFDSYIPTNFINYASAFSSSEADCDKVRVAPTRSEVFPELQTDQATQ